MIAAFRLAAVALGLLCGHAPAAPCTDSAGRTVDIPQHIERVFAAGPPAAIVLFTLAPDNLLG
jgi:iron complex transport system substrate-binding protein